MPSLFRNSANLVAPRKASRSTRKVHRSPSTPRLRSIEQLDSGILAIKDILPYIGISYSGEDSPMQIEGKTALVAGAIVYAAARNMVADQSMPVMSWSWAASGIRRPGSARCGTRRTGTAHVSGSWLLLPPGKHQLTW
jgi:hypothetical protein